MNRNVQIYVDGLRLDLFEDEQVTVMSSVQNVADISKLYTDFSQSFTVPASPNNNAIFEHFYETDVQSTINPQIRRPAIIEIDLTTFRRGQVHMERGQLLNGYADNYTITFYGETRTLRDLFGDDKMRDLDFSAYTHAYTGAEVQARVTDGATDYDIRYPLISSNRLWDYNGAIPANNIDTTGGAIVYTELFPALRVPKILDVIQDTYGVTFTGTILSDQRLTKLFMLCKNRQTFTVATEKKKLFVNPILVEYNENDAGVGSHSISLFISDTSNSNTYYIEVFKDGSLFTTITGSGNAQYQVDQYANEPGLDVVYRFYVYADSSMSLKGTFQDTQSFFQFVGGNPDHTVQTDITYGSLVSLTANLNLSMNMPDITVSDFFTGLLKKFNLTCYPTSENVFQVEPLDDWYNKGAIVDITQHVDDDSIEVERLKLYKSIQFQHAKSESFMNVQFSQLYNREYGDLLNNFEYDGGDYNISVPFENLLQQKFTGTDTQVGYCLTKDFNSYVPKPILLYMYDEQETDIYFDNDTTVDNITTYVPFGQDLLYNTYNYSYNFGAEVSPLLEAIVPNSVYSIYYFGYLNNLFNPKNRMTRLKAVLPISLLTNLKLNDRLIVSNKRYIINDMNTNLTTGEVQFSLINDFRQLAAVQYIVTDARSKCLQVPILFPNECIPGLSSAEITTATPGVTITPDTLTEDGIIVVCIPVNPDEAYYRITEDGQRRITEDSLFRITEEDTESQIIELLVTFDTGQGTTTTTIISVQTP